VKRWIVLSVLLGWDSALFGQPFGASGGEFRVNATTTHDQFAPAVAFDSAGGFIVAWNGGSGEMSKTLVAQIYVQRFTGTGSPVGGELLVNAFTTAGDQFDPRVAASSPGRFVIVWEDAGGSDGDQIGVIGQRYVGGVPAGTRFQVNTYTTSNEQGADVSADLNGNFIVVWAQPSPLIGSIYDIFGRRYTSDGAPLTAPFQINTYTTAFQFDPAVARSATGEFVVVWSSQKQFGSYNDIVGQRFTGAGSPLGGEFRIDATTTEDHGNPAVAATTGLGFVVVWQSSTGGFSNVFGRRYDSSGAALTAPFRVNTTTTSNQLAPTVSADANGNFAVVWRAEGQDDIVGVYAQRYASTGAPIGGEFRVNTYTTGVQSNARVAAADLGNLVVVWESDSNQDGSGYGVYAQRYCKGLAGDADGNGALGVGDVFYLINSLFAGGLAPVHGSDVNGDGILDVNDIFFLINYLFAGGPSPVCVP
jgi:hypothetical protein